MTSTASLKSTQSSIPNKRGQGLVGSDLVVTYHSDLAQCEILAPGSRYINSGNFKAGSFLLFHQPPFIQDLYPDLLSTEDGENSGLPILLSMFSIDAKTSNIGGRLGRKVVRHRRPPLSKQADLPWRPIRRLGDKRHRRLYRLPWLCLGMVV